MQDIDAKNELNKDNSKIEFLLFEDKRKAVDIFSWLIQEDKKQNPELYKINKLKI